MIEGYYDIRQKTILIVEALILRPVNPKLFLSPRAIGTRHDTTPLDLLAYRVHGHYPAP